MVLYHTETHAEQSRPEGAPATAAGYSQLARSWRRIHQLWTYAGIAPIDRWLGPCPVRPVCGSGAEYASDETVDRSDRFRRRVPDTPLALAIRSVGAAWRDSAHPLLLECAEAIAPVQTIWMRAIESISTYPSTPYEWGVTQ